MAQVKEFVVELAVLEAVKADVAPVEVLEAAYLQKGPLGLRFDRCVHIVVPFVDDLCVHW